MQNSYIRLHIEVRKDTFYRLKNNPSICWRLVLWLFASRFRKITEEHGEKTGAVKCMVFDDTLLNKTGRCKGIKAVGTFHRIVETYAVFVENVEEKLLGKIIQNDKVYEKLILTLGPLNHEIAAQQKINKWKL